MKTPSLILILKLLISSISCQKQPTTSVVIPNFVTSSVHKAKGPEADEVFIVERTLFETDEQQERNLLYVAITRSLKNLYFIKPSYIK